ncbi:MAG TPA: pilin [Candidatus Saccharimonadales bacterium]|jgi:uncharacterized membrane protein YidH (DUF202 family)
MMFFAYAHTLAAHIAQTLPSAAPLPRASANQGEINKVLTIVFTIVGAVSLLIVVIAGFELVISQGDPQKVSKAKDTITYAAIGIAISVLAVTLVGFFIKQVGPG